MKLWKKMALWCSLVLLLVVGICSAILITQAKDKILNLTYSNAEQKQQALTRSFKNMLLYYHEEQDSEAATRSLMKYCFTRYADSEAVMIFRGETLYSDIAIDPVSYLSPAGQNKPQRYTGMINGRQILIVGSDAGLTHTFSRDRGTPPNCEIYIVQDITAV